MASTEPKSSEDADGHAELPSGDEFAEKVNESPQHDIHDEGDLRDPHVTVDRDGNDALVWGDLYSDASAWWPAGDTATSWEDSRTTVESVCEAPCRRSSETGLSM